jgi:hypothetical protein
VFGVNLRAALAKSAFPHREALRKHLRIPSATLNVWERRGTLPSDELARIADALGVSAGQLLGAACTSAEGPTVAGGPPATGDAEADAIEVLAALPAAARARVLAYAAGRWPA